MLGLSSASLLRQLEAAAGGCPSKQQLFTATSHTKVEVYLRGRHGCVKHDKHPQTPPGHDSYCCPQDRVGLLQADLEKKARASAVCPDPKKTFHSDKNLGSNGEACGDVFRFSSGHTDKEAAALVTESMDTCCRLPDMTKAVDQVTLLQKMSREVTKQTLRDDDDHLCGFGIWMSSFMICGLGAFFTGGASCIPAAICALDMSDD